MRNNSLYGRDIVTIGSLSKAEFDIIFETTSKMKKLVMEKGGDRRLFGKVVACMFYEPSTRTFTSFNTAAQRLGAGTIQLSSMGHTSVEKGETLDDTVRVLSHYADALILRHPESGSVKRASELVSIPVINAGDGINEHPTQALIDGYTILKAFGKIEGLHILIIGDLAHYRPTNSLAKLLALYPKVKLSFATPKQVPLPKSVRHYLQEKKVNFKEYNDFDHILSEVDVLYVTRVKKEYMSDALYKKVQGSYIVDKKTLKIMKKRSIVMHCLPRVGEIATEVDRDRRAVYLNQQVSNGLYLRMALLDLLLRKG